MKIYFALQISKVGNTIMQVCCMALYVLPSIDLAAGYSMNVGDKHQLPIKINASLTKTKIK